MESFQITGEDASKIALALIADKFKGQSTIPVEALQLHWAELGLRLDDLVQGLTLLTREQHLQIDGNIEGSSLILSDEILETLADGSQGLADLDAPLQEILKIAANRSGTSSDSSADERRDGFK